MAVELRNGVFQLRGLNTNLHALRGRHWLSLLNSEKEKKNAEGGTAMERRTPKPFLILGASVSGSKEKVPCLLVPNYSHCHLRNIPEAPPTRPNHFNYLSLRAASVHRTVYSKCGSNELVTLKRIFIYIYIWYRSNSNNISKIHVCHPTDDTKRN